jgi:hypothetical protein
MIFLNMIQVETHLSRRDGRGEDHISRLNQITMSSLNIFHFSLMIPCILYCSWYFMHNADSIVKHTSRSSAVLQSFISFICLQLLRHVSQPTQCNTVLLDCITTFCKDAALTPPKWSKSWQAVKSEQHFLHLFMNQSGKFVVVESLWYFLLLYK